jgi:hypothetical protein
MNPKASFGVLYPTLRGITLTVFGCRMNSANKYYGTSFVIFESHSFDLQALVHSVSEVLVS